MFTDFSIVMHQHLPAYHFTHEYRVIRVQVPLRFCVMLTTHLMLEQVLPTYVRMYGGTK